MELKVNLDKNDDQTKQVSNKDKSQQSKSMSGSSVQPLMKMKLGKNKKDNQTKKVSDKDQSQQSKSTSDSSKTNSAGIKQASKSQLHAKDNEGSQAQQTDTNLVKADAHLETESLEQLNNSESVTEGDTKQLTAAESSGMKDDGQTQPQDESKLTDETAQKDSEQEVIDNECLMSGTEQLAVQVASSAELKTDEVKEALNSEEELPQRSESPSPVEGSTQVAELQDKENAGDVVKDRENEQSGEKIVSSEADVSDSKKEPSVVLDPCEEKVDGKETLGHDLTERHKKHTEQPQMQSKHEVRRKEGLSEHSLSRKQIREGLSKHSSRRRQSRERSEADSCRNLATMIKQGLMYNQPQLNSAEGERHSSYWRHQQYDPGVQYSGHDNWERHSQHDSMRETFDSTRWRYHYDQSGHVYNITRLADHSREKTTRYDWHRLPDLEDISSDEEIAYQDGGNHCCRFCRARFETISSLLEHLQSAAHEQVFKNFVYIFNTYKYFIISTFFTYWYHRNNNAK